MNPQLTGQVAIVTGASRGIGAAIAEALRACGVTVVDASRSAVPSTDVSDETSVAAMFERVRCEHGQLDILVNNAGVGVFGPTQDFGTADLDRILAVNVRGTFLCCREAIRLMRTAGRGTIINISSVTGVKGYAEQAAYSASKHAVVGLTRSLSAELRGTGVRVSVVLPGGVDTEMAASARPDLERAGLLRPEDVAETVLYLLGLPPHASVDQIHLRRAASEPL